MIILQWNATSLISNGQEFKGHIDRVEERPEIICIQETWLRPNLVFSIKGYDSIRRDREGGSGAGCGIFIKRGIQYQILGNGKELEYIVVEIWGLEGQCKTVNFNNPCKLLSHDVMEELMGYLEGNVVWCGDFNADVRTGTESTIDLTFASNSLAGISL